MGFKENVLCITILFITAGIFPARGFVPISEWMPLLEVIPLNLGIETNGGIMTNIIPLGSYFPTRKSQLFKTNMDNQTSVLIKVYDGECVFTKDCGLLGRFELSGITPAPRRAAQIQVTFHLDGYGTLNVTAEDKLSRKSKTVTISAKPKETEAYNAEAVENQEDFWKMIRPIDCFA